MPPGRDFWNVREHRIWLNQKREAAAPPTCQIISGPLILPGWICCQPSCRTYNGMWRKVCKHCGHKRCELPLLSQAEVERLWRPFVEQPAPCTCLQFALTSEDRQTGPRLMLDGWHHPRCERVGEDCEDGR